MKGFVTSKDVFLFLVLFYFLQFFCGIGWLQKSLIMMCALLCWFIFKFFLDAAHDEEEVGRELPQEVYSLFWVAFFVISIMTRYFL
jgi:hypothetical protein